MPAVAIVQTGFEKICAAMAELFGYPVRTSLFPGVVMTQSDEELREKVLGPVLDGSVRGLTVEEPDPITGPWNGQVADVEPEPDEIVATGTL